MISDSFDRLAAVRGIESTGAAKVLHLLIPRVFMRMVAERDLEIDAMKEVLQANL